MTESTMTSEQLNDLRKRYLNGEPWTREELKSAIRAMISNRLAQTAESVKPKAAAKKVDLSDLM